MELSAFESSMACAATAAASRIVDKCKAHKSSQKVNCQMQAVRGHPMQQIFVGTGKFVGTRHADASNKFPAFLSASS